ncbi:MAG: CCA tRNA nucleotidyltransferase, partial [Planctomycetota bacterium]
MDFIEQQLSQTTRGKEARRIIDALSRAGFQAVLAGGCVRDGLLGRRPKDFDVATDATPDAVRRLFGHRSTLAFGASFGVIGVLPSRADRRDESDTIEPTEVATFRADGEYLDGRRPDAVTFGDAQADAQRRDFTINGMFYDPQTSSVIDHVGGQQDLADRRLRTIGDPAARFDEDKLRMLRAVRFATILGFDLDAETAKAIRKHADSMSIVSGERIGAEMVRVLMHPRVVDGLSLLIDVNLHRCVWPHLDSASLPRIQQNLNRLDGWSFEVAMAVICDAVSGNNDAATGRARKMARERLKAWRRSGAESRAVDAALRDAAFIAACCDLPWSQLQPRLIDRDCEVTLDVAVAIYGLTEGIQRARRERERDPDSLNPQPLLTGDDLVSLGHRPNAHFKDWLT